MRPLLRSLSLLSCAVARQTSAELKFAQLIGKRSGVASIHSTSARFSTDPNPSSLPNAETSVNAASVTKPKLPTSIKSLNKILSTQQTRELPEDELEEKFVRGSGPGGQCINKTSSSVCLTHIPTGIRVQCQPTRSLQQNRRAARRLLRDKVDQHLNPGKSKDDIRWEKERRRKLNRSKKKKKKDKDNDVEADAEITE